MSVDFQKLQEDVSDIRGMLLTLTGQLKQPETTPADEILSVGETADFLNLTTQTIYGLVSARKIPFSKPTGSRLYFSRLELIEWLKSNRTATVQEQAAQFEQNRSVRKQSQRGGRKAIA